MRAKKTAVALTLSRNLALFDVSIIAALLSVLLLIQPHLAFGADSGRFHSSNTELNTIVNKGPVYIDFWASWCEACKESLPWLAKLKSEGVNVVTVNLDSEKTNAEELLTKLNIKGLPVVFDPEGKLPEELNLATMPESLLIGADAKILKVHSGFHPSEKVAREAEIRAAVLK